MSDQEQQTTENAQTAQPSQPARPTRVMSQQMGIYYSNCALVALSPRDVSLFFGRYFPMSDGKGPTALGELYERQVYMTIEQAEDLVRMLTESIQGYKARKVETVVNNTAT